jgi:hypothetical protein
MYSRNTYACVLLADKKSGYGRFERAAAPRGKVERRANLARFQNVANAVLKPGAVPAELILERLVEKNLFQFLDSLVAEKVLFGFLRSPLLRLATLGLRSTSFPVWL